MHMRESLPDPVTPEKLLHAWENHRAGREWALETERDAEISHFAEGHRLPDAPPDVPFRPSPEKRFTFIDLFAGIGGFRLALQHHGGHCVFTSEIDPAAREVYRRNFGVYPYGDIRQFTGTEISDAQLQERIPDHDVLAAGFPCQPFSRAGVSARNAAGIGHGFDDEVSGTLFFDILRIARVKRPKVLFLENVQNLMRHDGGHTFDVIRRHIDKDFEGSLGYHFRYEVIDSSRMVPQRRKRTYIIATRLEPAFEFDLEPFETGDPIPLAQALETDPHDSFTISDQLWKGHQERTQKNLARGVGFTAFLADLRSPANTLVARYGKDGKECLIPQPGRNPRMLTPRECANLQGFPAGFVLADAKTTAYRQFGNAVAVPVVTELAGQIQKHLESSRSIDRGRDGRAEVRRSRT